jgi:hypothetical protein
MKITVTKNNYGYFCETIYQGCRYGQLYKDMSLEQAEANFRRIVYKMANGNVLQVLSGK